MILLKDHKGFGENGCPAVSLMTGDLDIGRSDSHHLSDDWKQQNVYRRKCIPAGNFNNFQQNFNNFISSYQVIFELDWILLMQQSRTKINSNVID